MRGICPDCGRIFSYKRTKLQIKCSECRKRPIDFKGLKPESVIVEDVRTGAELREDIMGKILIGRGKWQVFGYLRKKANVSR